MTEQQAPPEKGADGSSHTSDAAGAGAQRSMSGGPRRSFNRQTTVPRKPLDVEKLGDGEQAAAVGLERRPGWVLARLDTMYTPQPPAGVVGGTAPVVALDVH